MSKVSRMVYKKIAKEKSCWLALTKNKKKYSNK